MGRSASPRSPRPAPLTRRVVSPLRRAPGVWFSSPEGMRNRGTRIRCRASSRLRTCRPLSHGDDGRRLDVIPAASGRWARKPPTSRRRSPSMRERDSASEGLAGPRSPAAAACARGSRRPRRSPGHAPRRHATRDAERDQNSQRAHPGSYAPVSDRRRTTFSGGVDQSRLVGLAQREEGLDPARVPQESLRHCGMIS